MADVSVRAVTPLVEPHGLLVVDAYDRARDDLAVEDPYATEWETHPHHGLIKPEDLSPVPAQFAGTPLSVSNAQDPGVERQPAGAPEPPPSSARGLAGTPTDL